MLHWSNLLLPAITIILAIPAHPSPSAAYHQIIQENPSSFAGLSWGLAGKLEEAGRETEAMQIYQQEIQQGAGEAYPYLALARLSEKNQQPDQAVQIYLQAIQKFPDDRPSEPGCHVMKHTSYDSLVKLLFQQKHLDQILTTLEQLHPQPSVEMYENLFLALEYRNHNDQAKVVLRRLNQLYPHAELYGKGGCE